MRAVIIAVALLGALPTLSPVRAQEPVGCDKFKWPLDRERALMANPIDIASGATIAEPGAAAYRIALAPQADAKLPAAPERASREPAAHAGFLRFAATSGPGTFRITLSANAWIDVIQSEKFVHAGEFSGVNGCDGLRKSVKFSLAAAPFTIQFSGATVQSLMVTVTRD
ncbi:hypothetical protein [Pseudolabrys sp. FHR47]|uniref:hypothetical protein n=1 Tax=Pseudolabrys sp. FHR47 TaxID=2562284 RepID=UPI0010BF5FDC|nr:hypothetical protein [Pseudolabrys sp. FHR47]